MSLEEDTTTEWFDEQYYPGPSQHNELQDLIKSFRVITAQVGRSYDHMAEQFERISKALFEQSHPEPDRPILPKERYTPPVRNHGPRPGKPYRSDGKRKW